MHIFQHLASLHSLHLLVYYTSSNAPKSTITKYPPNQILLPNIRKQIIISPKRLTLRLLLRRGCRRTTLLRRRRTTPPAKVIILRNLRCTPTRALRPSLRGRRSCRLTRRWRGGTPHIVTAPRIHVREAAVADGCWGGLYLRLRYWRRCGSREVKGRVVRGRRYMRRCWRGRRRHGEVEEVAHSR
jgi:hypothetical protein